MKGWLIAAAALALCQYGGAVDSSWKPPPLLRSLAGVGRPTVAGPFGAPLLLLLHLFRSS